MGPGVYAGDLAPERWDPGRSLSLAPSTQATAQGAQCEAGTRHGDGAEREMGTEGTDRGVGAETGMKKEWTQEQTPSGTCQGSSPKAHAQRPGQHAHALQWGMYTCEPQARQERLRP